MANGLARPLEELARQAGEVVRGEPRPVDGAGTREIEAWRARSTRRSTIWSSSANGSPHRAHRRTTRDRAAGGPRDQESAGPHPRRGRDAAAAASAQRPGLRRLLRRGHPDRARPRSSASPRSSPSSPSSRGSRAASRARRARRGRQERRRALRSRRSAEVTLEASLVPPFRPTAISWSRCSPTSSRTASMRSGTDGKTPRTAWSVRIEPTGPDRVAITGRRQRTRGERRHAPQAFRALRHEQAQRYGARAGHRAAHRPGARRRNHV